jgi:5-formyltetrahydrofolate cyclo-ligase
MPVDGEVDLRVVADRLRGAGWSLALPVVGPDGTMAFHRWEPDGELRPNRYGIDEPVGSEPVGVEDLDVVVVPAVGVDRHGNRLGFGAGFYDRALSDRPADLLTVAAVFECQLVDRLEPRPWDVPVDVVVTERAVYRRGGGGTSGGL